VCVCVYVCVSVCVAKREMTLGGQTEGEWGAESRHIYCTAAERKSTNIWLLKLLAAQCSHQNLAQCLQVSNHVDVRRQMPMCWKHIQTSSLCGQGETDRGNRQKHKLVWYFEKCQAAWSECCDSYSVCWAIFEKDQPAAPHLHTHTLQPLFICLNEMATCLLSSQSCLHTSTW